MKQEIYFSPSALSAPRFEVWDGLLGFQLVRKWWQRNNPSSHEPSGWTETSPFVGDAFQSCQQDEKENYIDVD